MRNIQSEQQIWTSFKAGDKDALGLIFETYYPVLHHYGLKLCGDSVLTEDVLQDFFLYLYEHREKLSDLSSLRAYFFTSFRRMLLRKLKTHDNRKAVFHEISDDYRSLQFTVEELRVEQEDTAYRLDVVVHTLNKLPNRQREVVYLKYFNDLNLQEIAEIMSITYQGVANTLYKAFKLLRKDPALLKIRKLGVLIAMFASWVL